MNKGKGYVDEGAGGCVFNPHILCSLKVPANRKTIGKVFTDDQYLSEIRKMTYVMEKIDKKSDFTVRFHGHCVINNDDFKALDEKEKCSRYAQAYDQLVYDYGGQSLWKIWRRYNAHLDDIIPYMRSLFYGIHMIRKAKFCHFDIKPDNILFDATSQKCRIVDFGLLKHLGKVYHPQNGLDHRYQWYAPEMKIWTKLYNKSFTNSSYEDVYYFFKENFSLVDIDDLIYHLPGLDSHFQVFYLYCKTQPDQAMLEIEKLDHKIDVYSLGMVLYITVREYVKIKKYNNPELARDLFILSKNMICFDPRKRYTTLKSLHHFDEILKKYNIHNK